jgi:hypothetical protein
VSILRAKAQWAPATVGGVETLPKVIWPNPIPGGPTVGDAVGDAVVVVVVVVVEVVVPAFETKIA